MQVQLLSLFLTAQAVSAQTLMLRFLDVGQGDAVLINAPRVQALLYDGGRSEARMRELIRQYRPERINVVIASYGDAESHHHISALTRPVP